MQVLRQLPIFRTFYVLIYFYQVPHYCFGIYLYKRVNWVKLGYIQAGNVDPVVSFLNGFQNPNHDCAIFVWGSSWAVGLGQLLPALIWSLKYD